MSGVTRVGTSGWAYAPWRGPFYPAGLADDELLPFYAQRFGAVEVNNTFYRMPKADVVSGWAAATPPTFHFVVKVSQRISHIKRLKPDDDGALDYLLSSLDALRGRATLFLQTPANLKADAARLEAFLERVGQRFPVVFEPKHPSWRDDPLVQARCPVSWTVSDEGADLPDVLPDQPELHLRLRRQAYDDAALDDVAARLARSGAGRRCVFFKHDDEATGPALAGRLLARLSPAVGG